MKNLILLSVLFVSFFSNAQTGIYEGKVTFFSLDGSNYIHVGTGDSIDMLGFRSNYEYPDNAYDQDYRMTIINGVQNIAIEELGDGPGFGERADVSYRLTGNGIISEIFHSEAAWNGQYNNIWQLHADGTRTAQPNLNLIAREWLQNGAHYSSSSYPGYTYTVGYNSYPTGNVVKIYLNGETLLISGRDHEDAVPGTFYYISSDADAHAWGRDQIATHYANN